MADPNLLTVAVTKLDISITIPATGSPATIRSLLSQAALNAIGANPLLDRRPKTVIGGKLLAAGGAWKWGTLTAATVTIPVTSTEVWNEPAGDFLDTLVASDATALAGVLGVLYLAE